MFPNDLQRTDIVETLFLKFLSYVYKFNGDFTKVPTFNFGCICGPKFQNLCFQVPGSLQIGTRLKIQLLLTRSTRGFHTFHSELSVVSAKRSLVSNYIESKSYSSLILHSV